MKAILVYFVVLILFGCSTKTEEPESKNIRLAKKVYECFNKHDWSGMAECYSDPVMFLDPSFGSSWITQTHKDIIKKYTQLQLSSPDIQDEIDAIYSDGGNHVIVEFTSRGTGSGGERWHLPICTVFTIENGKIIKDATYYDN